MLGLELATRLDCHVFHSCMSNLHYEMNSNLHGDFFCLLLLLYVCGPFIFIATTNVRGFN